MLKASFYNMMSAYTSNRKYIDHCWQEIELKYSHRSRYYHTLAHLEMMLSELKNVLSQVHHQDTLRFAIYYHDIIYKPGRSDNEAKSALRFEERISKTSFKFIKECKAQIEATKEHKRSTDKDTNILMDLDLLILGQTPEVYESYCNNIRREFSAFPNFLYRKGRKEFLERFLALDTIYKVNYFKEKFEEQARKNLQRELENL
ncbi:HD domain-containing protein [Altibacter lentus]|uniref:HD domain-containing protein n=1 Tax=Altibacter lentus TaxID=1223410 RepID=UPI000559207D|nr:hypothetical protein [Altibacter lentus]